MRLGSLFSGAGMGDFGFLAAGMDIAWQCEIDAACQRRLALRYPESKKYRDIRKLKGSEIEKVDIICGGFPCQPFSVAGKQQGAKDDRNLWPEMLRVIKECGPRWVVGENVPGLINMGEFDCEPPVDGQGLPCGDPGDVWTRTGRGILDKILASLEEIGYEAWPVVFPAHALGAWHRRDRIWIVAHTQCEYGTGEAVAGEHEGPHRSRNAAEHQRSDECRKSGAASGAGEIVADSGHHVRAHVQGAGNHGQAVANQQERSQARGELRGSGRGQGGASDVADAQSVNEYGRRRSRRARAGSSDGGEDAADPANAGLEGLQKRAESAHENVPDAKTSRSQKQCHPGRNSEGFTVFGRGGSNDHPWREFWATEPAVGRVVNGFATELDATIRRLGYEYDLEKAITKIDQFRREILREMRNHGKFATASYCASAEGYINLMSVVSQERAHEGWNMGSWIASDAELHNLWQRFYAQSFEKSENVLTDLLVRIREKECKQKVALDRVDRLKMLGNSQCPPCTYVIGKYILEVERQLNEKL